MAFGEDSWLSADNGKDMIWNPSSNRQYMGGQHWIYVFKSGQAASGQGNRMPPYDRGQFIMNELGDNPGITNEKKEAEYEKNLTKNGVNALTREIEHLRRDTEQDKKKIIDLIRFRDMMSKSIKKAEDENKEKPKKTKKKAKQKNDIETAKEPQADEAKPKGATEPKAATKSGATTKVKSKSKKDWAA